MELGPIQAAVVPRPLGALEKMFWLIDQNRPIHFAMAAEVDGTTSVEKWQSAVDRVCRRSALIWSRIAPDERGLPAFWPVSRGSIPLRVVNNAASAWTDHVAAELTQPIDASKAPLLRATLLHGPDRAVIILCVHHSVADGLALTYLLRDVLRAYAGEPVQLSDQTAAVEHLVASRRGIAARGEAQVPPPAPSPMAYRVLDKVPTVKALRFPRSMTQSLRARARIERTTVQGALCAAVAAATSQAVPGWSEIPLRVVSPVDVRGRMLRGSEDFGLCVTGFMLEDDPDAPDFWPKARFLTDQLKAMASAEGVATRTETLGRGVAALSTVQEARDFFGRRFGSEIIVTNLGAVELEETYGSLRLKALWGPVVMSSFANGQAVGAVTIRDELRLVHASHGPPDLLGKVSSILNAALEGSSGDAAEPGRASA